MTTLHDSQAAHRRRWMRPNAHLYIRQDAGRFMAPGAPRLVGAEVVKYFESVAGSERDLPTAERKYSPNQPRIPAGRFGGGRWTDGSSLAGPSASGAPTGGTVVGEDGDITWDFVEMEVDGLPFLQLVTDPIEGIPGLSELASPGDGNERQSTGGDIDLNDPRVISDAAPDDLQPGAQYAANRGRGPVSVRINGKLVEVTGGQAARLVEAQARAEAAIARVRELDPSWRPSPSAYESAEGLIRAYEADARAAQSRASELARMGIGPGPFAGESIPARGPGRNFTAEERREINRIGAATGCHTCGTKVPGTTSGDFVLDHQISTGLNFGGRAQRLYPQCMSCSARQGGLVRSLRAR
jgi:hypothetical protein